MKHKSTKNRYEPKNMDIAIIGIAGIFPQADNVEEFWSNLAFGRDSIRTLSKDRLVEIDRLFGDGGAVQYAKAGYLDRLIGFEPEIFGLGAEEACYIDFEHRIVLKLVEEAMLNAGYSPQSFRGKEVDVYLGKGEAVYSCQLATASSVYEEINKIPSINAGRIAYTYDLHGSAVVINAACSSSLVSIHYACQSLYADECEYAIAGASEVIFMPIRDEARSISPVLSKDQKVKAFDDSANGTVPGEGGGILLLKKLKNAVKDKDPIHAVIKASVVNNNGSTSNGIIAPSEEGQIKGILKLLSKHDDADGPITYVEMHGTGTKVGDPIEMLAFDRAFSQHGYLPNSVAIGSLKTNIGHLNPTSGVAGVIKTVLMLKNKVIPPTLHFHQLNRLSKSVDSTLYINSYYNEWHVEKKRNAIVASTGFIGTNCYLLLSENPYQQAEKSTQVADQNNQLILFQARTRKSLLQNLIQLRNYLIDHQAELRLEDVVYTMNTGRRKFPVRCALWVNSIESLIASITEVVKMSDTYIFTSPPTTHITQLPLYMILSQNAFETRCSELQTICTLLSPNGIYFLDWPDQQVPSAQTNSRMKENSGTVSACELLGMLQSQKIGDDGVFCLVCCGDEAEELVEQIQARYPKNRVLYLNDWENSLTDNVSRLLSCGFIVNWEAYYEGTTTHRVALPGYVFDECEYAIPVSAGTGKETQVKKTDHTDIGSRGTNVEHKLFDLFLLVTNMKVEDHEKNQLLSQQTRDLNINSIVIIEFTLKVKKELNMDVPYSIFFQGLQLSEVFHRLAIMDTLLADNDNGDIIRQPKQLHYPMSNAQKRLFLIYMMDKQQTNYNIPGALEIKGTLDIERMDLALQQLVLRHESLRTTFHMVNGELVQRVHEKIQAHLLSEECSSDRYDEIVARFVVPHSLDQAPLIRMKLVKIDITTHLLLFDVHHIVADGISVGILVNDFVALYRGAILPELPVQYKDYTVWMEQELKKDRMNEQERYWITKLKDAPMLKLPYDYKRPDRLNRSGSSILFALDANETKQIIQIAANMEASLYAFLLSIYLIVLYKYTAQNNMVIGTPVSGRNHDSILDVVGMFVNTIVLRNRISGNLSYDAFLRELKQNVFEAFENQDYPFDQLIDSLDFNREENNNPLFSTMFALHNMTEPRLEVEGLSFRQIDMKSQVVKMDLELEVYQVENILRFELEYSQELFRNETILQIKDDYEKILVNMIREFDPMVEINSMILNISNHDGEADAEFNFDF